MSLESIYYVSQTVAVIAILGSLIALILQTRHTHLQNRQSIEQSLQANELAKAELMTQTMGVGAQIQSNIFGAVESASLMYRGMVSGEGLTPEEGFRFYIQMTNLISAQEMGFRLQMEGLAFDDFIERARRNNLAYFRSERARRWWRRARDEVYVEPFRSWLNEIVEEAERIDLAARGASKEGVPLD